MNYTYILRCADGSLYCGWTNDLEKRLAAHNAGTASKCTRVRRPVELKYFELFPTPEEAQSREYRIKKTLKRAEKEALIAASTPEQRIRRRLWDLRDEPYGDFTAKLLPTVERRRILGVRAPALQKLAKELRGTEDAAAFLTLLPHGFLEENGLHAALLNLEKDFDAALAGVEAFLPFVDNWGTCDSLAPAVFAKHPAEVLERARDWLRSGHTYTARFGIDVLMRWYLEEAFTPEHLQWVREACRGEYYVDIAAAWYYSVALVKQWDAAVALLESGALDKWTHNRSIRKAVESRRIDDEQKAYLKTLRRR